MLYLKVNGRILSKVTAEKVDELETKGSVHVTFDGHSGHDVALIQRLPSGWGTMTFEHGSDISQLKYQILGYIRVGDVLSHHNPDPNSGVNKPATVTKVTEDTIFCTMLVDDSSVVYRKDTGIAIGTDGTAREDLGWLVEIRGK